MKERYIQEEKLKKAFHNKDSAISTLYQILYGTQINWDSDINGADINAHIKTFFDKFGDTTYDGLSMFCDHCSISYPEDANTFSERVHEIMKHKSEIHNKIG